MFFLKIFTLKGKLCLHKNCLGTNFQNIQVTEFSFMKMLKEKANFMFHGEFSNLYEQIKKIDSFCIRNQPSYVQWKTKTQYLNICQIS